MEMLLDEAIDYAGQFPPARLGLSEALGNYLRFRRGSEAWLVGRFVCGADKLAALAEALPEGGAPFEVAVVSSAPPRDRATWNEVVERDVNALNAFLENAPEYADVASYEVRLPTDTEPTAYLRDLNGLREIEVFVEVPGGPEMDEILAALAETQWMHAKLRTGGLEASAYPDAWTLAGFLKGCLDLDVPGKLTAGLHHALPTWDDTIRTTQHGFLNVFGGAAIASANELSRRELERLLLDQSPESWSFEDDGIAWRGQEASLDDIDETRAVVRAFGSCSVEEPMEELKALGLFTPSTH